MFGKGNFLSIENGKNPRVLVSKYIWGLNVWFLFIFQIHRRKCILIYLDPDMYISKKLFSVGISHSAVDHTNETKFSKKYEFWIQGF